MKIKLTYQTIQEDVDVIADKIILSGNNYRAIYGIPRGGVPIAVMLSYALNIPLYDNDYPLDETVLIVDDLVDSGKTLAEYSGLDTAVLYAKPTSHVDGVTYYSRVLDGWVEFPYEETERDDATVLTRLEEMLRDNPELRAIVIGLVGAA